MSQAGRQLAAAASPHPVARLNDNSFLMLADSVDETTLAALAQQLRGPGQDCAALFGRGRAPCDEATLRRLERAIQIGRGGKRQRRLARARRRIEHVARIASLAAEPFAGDVEAEAGVVTGRHG